MSCLLVSVMLMSARVDCHANQELKDFTTLKYVPAAPKKEGSGFSIFGKNATALIRTLKAINGISIEKLEKDMRPGGLSSSGFLGKEEKLLDVLAADNDLVVVQLGLTHQQLARHLHAMGKIATWQRENKQEGTEFLYFGRKYKIKVEIARGKQESPFDDGTSSGTNITVDNLTSGKTLKYGLLLADMIDRYGFYEGKGTPYRLEPRRVVEVFDFMLEKKKND